MAPRSLLLSVLLAGAAASQPGFFEQLNAKLAEDLPKLASDLVSEMPRSYGDNGPAPCAGNGDYLFYEHKDWEYKVFMRWITGLRTLHLSSAVASRASQGLTLAVKGYFAELPASIYVGECFTLGYCSKLWDNEHACCGSNKHFEVVLSGRCSSTSSQDPLDSFTLGSVSIDEIKVTESIGDLSFDLAKITDKVKDQLQTMLKLYLTKEAFINYGGETLTLVQYINKDPELRRYAAEICYALPPVPLKVIRVDSFDKSYSDSGTGADKDVSMWRPRRSTGQFYAGDACSPNYDAPGPSFVLEIGTDAHALAVPTAMRFMWNDRDTGASTDGGFFLPVCPDGYYALGTVGEQFLSDDERSPSPSRWPGLRCVSAWYVEHWGADHVIWADHGSGGKYDGTVFAGAVDTYDGARLTGPCVGFGPDSYSGGVGWVKLKAKQTAPPSAVV